MSSVRSRIEHDQRHAAEKIVVLTSDRRVALTSNPTMSTRMQQQLAEDQNNPEVARPREVTSSASTGCGNSDSFSRVRDRQVVAEAMKPEAARPKTEVEQAGDYYFALYKQREAEKKAEEQAKTQARQKREADERAAADARRQAEAARQRKAQYAFAENAVLHECSDLSPAEHQIFWARLVAMNCCLDAGRAAIVAEEIRLARKD